MEDSDVVEQDVLKACAGDTDSLTRLFSKFTPQLERMVRLRLDPKLRARVSAEDILQQAYCEALKRLPEYCEDQSMPFYLWLRFLAAQELINARRYHLGVQKRSVDAEVSLHRGALPQVDTASLARQLIGKFTSPTQAALRSEVQLAIQGALNEMAPIDREIIVLRHFEHMSNNEVAQLLDLQKATASKRYVVALKRLQTFMSGTDQ